MLTLRGEDSLGGAIVKTNALSAALGMRHDAVSLRLHILSQTISLQKALHVSASFRKKHFIKLDKGLLYQVQGASDST